MADRRADLLSLDEAARRLGGISRNTLLRRLAEAGIRPPKPGRYAMLTEGDFAARVLAMRARSPAPPAPAPPPRTPMDALRAAARRNEGRRIAEKTRGKVVALGLEK